MAAREVGPTYGDQAVSEQLSAAIFTYSYK